MATKLQNELFRKNPIFIELAQNMAEQVYPRIFDLIKQLGIEELLFEKVGNFKNFCFNLDGKLVFFDGKINEKTAIYQLDLSGKKICTLFEETNSSSIEIFQSPIDNYSVFCNAVIDAIKPLEDKISHAKELIDKINRIKNPLKRYVIIEKKNKIN